MIAWIKRSLICDRVGMRFLSTHTEGLWSGYNFWSGGWWKIEVVRSGASRRYRTPEKIYNPEWEQEIHCSFIPGKRMVGSNRSSRQCAIYRGRYFLLLHWAGTTCLHSPFTRQISWQWTDLWCLFPPGMRIANKKVVESSGLDEKSNPTWGLKNKKDLLRWDTRIELIAPIPTSGRLR